MYIYPRKADCVDYDNHDDDGSGLQIRECRDCHLERIFICVSSPHSKWGLRIVDDSILFAILFQRRLPNPMAATKSCRTENGRMFPTNVTILVSRCLAADSRANWFSYYLH